MPITTMLNRCVEETEFAREDTDLPGNFARRQVPTQAHSPSGRTPHFMAQPTWVETQNSLTGVSGMKTDSIRRTVLGESQQELHRAVLGHFLSPPTGVLTRKCSASSGAQLDFDRFVICSKSVMPLA